MPAENSYGLQEIVALLREYDFTHQRRLSFEYTMFEGVNDTLAHAKELLRLLGRGGMPDELDSFPSRSRRGLEGDVGGRHVAFSGLPDRARAFFYHRASRGQDIFAACGLLSTAKQQGVELKKTE